MFKNCRKIVSKTSLLWLYIISENDHIYSPECCYILGLPVGRVYARYFVSTFQFIWAIFCSQTPFTLNFIVLNCNTGVSYYCENICHSMHYFTNILCTCWFAVFRNFDADVGFVQLKWNYINNEYVAVQQINTKIYRKDAIYSFSP